MKKEIAYLLELSPEEILAEPVGKWSDSDLLDVYGEFANNLETEKETAILELILQSPQHDDEMVDYNYIFYEILANHRHLKDFNRAIYWTVAAIGYMAQQFRDELNLRNYQRELAENYLRQGDIANGLRLFTRLVQTNPGDFWTQNQLADVLPDVGLHELAIEMLDCSLAVMKEYDPEGLTEQFEEFRLEISAEMATAVATPPDIDPAILQAFRSTLALPPLPEGSDSLEYIAPVSDLFEQGDTLDNKLQQAIVANGRVLIPDLIWLAFDDTYWETHAPTHAITLLRQIRQNEPALESIGRWLDQADNNWHTLISDKIGKTGSYTMAELKAFAADTNYNVYLRSDAAEILLQRMSNSPDQREDIIAFMRLLLTRAEAYLASEELFIAFLVANINDTDAKELYPEIKQVFDEDRIDPTITDLSFIHEKWGMLALPPDPERRRTDGLYLTFQCTECQRIRIHFVQHVIIDATTMAEQDSGHETPYDPHIMDRPIICPRCGAVDRYKIDQISAMRLLMGDDTENMMALLLGQSPKNVTPHKRVTQVHPQAFGRAMHPLVALDKYKEIAKRNPKQAEPHWRMGNILRSIWRDEQAKEAYLRALDLDPNETWSLYALAMTEHDLGNLDKAKALYEQTVRTISPMEMMRDEELADTSLSAADGLKRLKKGLPSSYAEDYRLPKPDKSSIKARRHQKQKRKKKRRR